MPVLRARRVLLLALVAVIGAVAGGVYAGLPVSARETAGAPAPNATPQNKPHPKHSESPSPTPTPTPTPTRTPTPTPTASPSPSASATSGAATGAATDAAAGDPTTTEAVIDETGIWWDLRPSFGGVYSTSSLMALEDRLRALDAPKRVLEDVYSPFIIEGPSQFSDTWGAVRHDAGNKLRPHVGQDVFCSYDAPVLAAEPGTVEFTTDRLGGTVVRLHRNDGGYWYYAHLSRYADGLASGDRVEAGDVIGHCGATGNARGGKPHVHFGSYPGPVNPMSDLVSWLEEAEKDAAAQLDRLLDRAIPGRAADIGTTLRVIAIERCPRAKTTPTPLELIVPTA